MLQGILESRRGTLPAVLINMLFILFTVISNGGVSNYWKSEVASSEQDDI
jgi:hypothetical protein